MSGEPIIAAAELSVHFGSGENAARAVDEVSLAIPSGCVFGLVGESGCGKSTLARALTGLLPQGAHYAGGSVLFDGQDLTRLSRRQWRALAWRRIAFIPQSAMNALDPVYRVGWQMREILCRRGGLSYRAANNRAAAVFESVGLSADELGRFPHQLSGGMRQRVSIALALALDPALIIADEPVTALDVIVQRQILDQLRGLAANSGVSILLITHDISVVAYACDRMAAMYAGQIVEAGPTASVLTAPGHPYVMGLRNAFPDPLNPDAPLVPIDGGPPPLTPPPSGCRFAVRCPFAQPACAAPPCLAPTEEAAHHVRCHRLLEANRLRHLSGLWQTWAA